MPATARRDRFRQVLNGDRTVILQALGSDNRITAGEVLLVF